MEVPAILLLLTLPLRAAVTFTEYPTPTPQSMPSQIAAGPDQAMWFTEPSANKIGRITSTGNITEFAVPTPASYPEGIAAGPDGAMWFCESFGKKIGRITMAGAITEFLAPTYTQDITAGPDGALWFTESDTKLGRITTAGAVTEIAVPAFASGLTTGPDGALWFIEFNENRIARVTTAGAITEYPLPTAKSFPGSLTNGPDGALWFTEHEPDRIGRITTAGVVTEFPTRTYFGAPGGIVKGPDGALWFIENTGNNLGRITTDGFVSLYVIPTSFSLPIAIAAGPDGALWFTESAGSQIGRATIAGNMSVTSSSPAAGAGNTQTFRFQFTDTLGYQDLGIVNVLFNNALDGRNACYLAYVVSSSTLVLVDDAGDAGGPFAGSTGPGGSAIQNSQCTVSLTSAFGSGTELTLVLALTFHPSFGGNHITYAAARDQSSANTGWQIGGVWKTPGLQSGPIGVQAIAPTTAAVTAGASQALTLTLIDNNGGADFGVVNLLVNSVIDGHYACYLAYEPFTGNLFLVNDAGDAGGPFAGVMSLTSGTGSVQNGQCGIMAAGSSAALSGNTLTLTVNMSFAAPFRGTQVLYVAGRDRAGANNTGWQPVGMLTVQ